MKCCSDTFWTICERIEMFDQSCGSVLCVEGSRKRARTERVGVSYAQRYGGRPSRLNEANSPSQPGCFPLGCQCSLCCVSLGSVPLSPSPSLQVPVQSVPVEPSLSVYVCVCVSWRGRGPATDRNRFWKDEERELVAGWRRTWYRDYGLTGFLWSAAAYRLRVVPLFGERSQEEAERERERERERGWASSLGSFRSFPLDRWRPTATTNVVKATRRS